jgi:sporulation integral membrane protein YlbJ
MLRRSKYLFSAPAITLMLGVLSFLLVVGIVSSPEQTFQASLQGLSLWWHIVFPSLLPFLVLSEMLIAYGWVHGIGVLLDPLMRRVFGLPGVSGWALTMGMTSGFPGGAQSTLQLVKQGDLTPREAERMAWLSHFSNPMTLIIVIGIGLFNQPSTGYWLISIHWLSGILAFLTMTSLGKLVRNKSSESPVSVKLIKDSKLPLPRKVWLAIYKAHIRDGRSFGKLLGESVSHAVQTLMVIGGYIIIMAVMIHLVSYYILPEVPTYYVAGIFELHLGAKAISSASSLTPIIKWSLLSAMLGWSGLCAILQSISPLMKSGVRWLPFILIRLLHGAYAFVITLFLWRPLELLVLDTPPAFYYWPNYSPDLERFSGMWSRIPLLLGWQGLILISLLLFSWSIVLATTRRYP